MKHSVAITGRCIKISIEIISFLFLLNISFNGFSQGKISQSKEELKKDSRDTKNKSNTSSYESSSGDDSFQAALVGVFFQGFTFATVYTLIGNYAAERHLHNNLTDYPYYNQFSGNYESPDSMIGPIKSSRFDLENKVLYSSDNLFGNHLKGKIRPFRYFYLQADYIQLFENFKIDKIHSGLSLFHINFCYDRIRLDKFNLGWVVGMSYVGNDVRKAGFSYGLNADLFALKNVSFGGSAKWSSINSAPIRDFEIESKFHRRSYFLSVGYEHLKIGTPVYNFMSLGGGIYL